MNCSRTDHRLMAPPPSAPQRQPSLPATMQPRVAGTAPSSATAAATPILNGCVSTGTIEATLLPPNILFLIDRSSSMNCNLPDITSSQDCERTATRQDPNQPSKWEIVKSALETAIGQLPD